MKIIYAGTPDFAVPPLQYLLESEHEIVAVYTQPDRPAGRGKKLRQSAVKQVAVEAGIPVYQPQSLRDAAAQHELEVLQVDLMVVAAYGLILPPEVLAMPRWGCVNIHASLLPRWRGAAPIQRAILAGDAETGVTIMQMAKGLDTGDMLLRREIPITLDDTSVTLHDKLAQLGAEALEAVMAQIGSQTLAPEPQDEALVTYAQKLDKQEAQIDWSQPAAQIHRQIRGFNAWPVAQTQCSLGTLRIWNAGLGDPVASPACGQVIGEDREQGIRVQTGDGTLWLTKIQLPGGKPLLAQDFLNGRSLAGECLGAT